MTLIVDLERLKMIEDPTGDNHRGFEYVYIQDIRLWQIDESQLAQNVISTFVQRYIDVMDVR